MWGGRSGRCYPRAIRGTAQGGLSAWVPDADARLPLNSLVRVISVSTAPDSKAGGWKRRRPTTSAVDLAGVATTTSCTERRKVERWEAGGAGLAAPVSTAPE